MSRKRQAVAVAALSVAAGAAVVLWPQQESTPVAPIPVASAAPAAGAAPEPDPLERTIAFEDAANCWPSASFRALLEQISPRDEIGRPKGVEAVVLPDIPEVTFGTPSLTSEDFAHQIDVPAQALWHGLHLTKVSSWWGEESDFSGFALHFVESPADVIRALNGLGFVLPPSGQRETDAELATSMAVAASGEGAVFSCST